MCGKRATALETTLGTFLTTRRSVFYPQNYWTF